jgi:hypothetical protein
MSARKKASARADVSCAVCGKPLELWDATTALDGRTVCAENCLGAGIVRARGLPEYQDDPPPCHQNDDTAPEGHHDG